MPRRFHLVLSIASCALALATAGCGGQQHHAASKHKQRSVLLIHAGLAYGAFERFILVPARAGQLANPLSPAVGRGAEAARFASKELRIAARHAQKSRRLKVLFASLEVTADKLKALAAGISQHVSISQIEEINGILRRIASIAKANGHRIVNASAARIAAAGGPAA